MVKIKKLKYINFNKNKKEIQQIKCKDVLELLQKNNILTKNIKTKWHETITKIEIQEQEDVPDSIPNHPKTHYRQP